MDEIRDEKRTVGWLEDWTRKMGRWEEGGLQMKISKDEFVGKISNFELSEDRAISKLSEQLQQYEKKYNLRSEIFYKLIVMGDVRAQSA